VGGLNTYGYALQNPLKFVDPEGLDAMCGPGFSWIPGDKHGQGTCEPNHKPNERDCLDGSCNSLDPIANTQCFKDCMNDAATSKPVLCKIAGKNKALKELCDKTADIMMCSEKCSKECDE